MMSQLKGATVLVTGGAGFIGSNLCEHLLENNIAVVCLDNFATSRRENVVPFLSNPLFTLIEGDICDEATCHHAMKGVTHVLHQAALGSVPRSINNPLATHMTNTTGFLNVLIAARDAQVKRFVYAASSSTYGDSTSFPKVEDVIGKPLSPYAVTKLVNELYADVFSKTYGFHCIGLRYFNVFGRRQDPNGAYAAVIPKFVMQFMNYESPIINGTGDYSRDFTYIDNVIQANMLALTTTSEQALNQVYNVAYGQRATLNEMASALKIALAEFDPKIADVEVIHGPNRPGDIPHSLASIEKARTLLGYDPQFDFPTGLKVATKWYFENLHVYVN